MTTAPNLLTVAEVAARLKVSRAHVYALIAQGALSAVDLSSPGTTKPKTRIREDELLAFVDGRSRTVATA